MTRGGSCFHAMLCGGGRVGPGGHCVQLEDGIPEGVDHDVNDQDAYDVHYNACTNLVEEDCNTSVRAEL